MDFSYVHIRYFIGYVYHICLQDTIQSTLSLCLRCQAMLLPMPLRLLLLTTQSGFNGAPSSVNPGDSATRQEVRLGGPPTRTRWGGYHLARPGGPPGPKGV